ncbi:M1 family metallopeptidase [Brevibacillus brevis]|uniref:M1 family metallopeptidase n=1 Tax=Brevibacillus brevis TaxID=1393 RepID=UPI00115A294B|nr:M1 family metallopeptidase [Lysinibacillus sp. SDF0063]TQR31144.1 M1 family peptidase [Lysinibacillus sp. SDF0063]
MWRKHWVVIVAVGVVLTVFLNIRPWTGQAGVDAQEIVPIGHKQAAVTYKADVQIDMNKHVVKGMLTARFFPKDDQAFFHLYPNAFSANAALSGENWEAVLGKQREPGGIRISEVRVNGKSVGMQYAGKTNTLLQVPLPARTSNAETVVEMNFQLEVPFNNGRMSYHDHAMWLGNWLPILAVKDAGGWRLDPYSAIGDPFYSDVANYHLRVQLSEGYQLATSGLESVAVITETRPQRLKIYEVDAWNVRDFALVVMDDTYQPISGKVGETIVRTWVQKSDDPQNVERIHETARESLDYYGKQFGVYPYKEYDVVKTGGFFGGMEYPGLVFIAQEYFDRNDAMGEAIVAHETAHQWFYGLVGNDEVREAWLDEGLTDYATMVFLQQKSPTRSQAYIQMRLGQAREAEGYANQGVNAKSSVEVFPDWRSYNDLVYGRAGAMWWNLKEEWGVERLHQVLRQYVRDHQYKQANGEQITALLTAAAGADASPYLDYWLQVELEKAKAANNWVEKGKHE